MIQLIYHIATPTSLILILYLSHPLAKKRVLFVGYNHAARDVCRAVLSAVAMVAPIPNIIHRTHPYANLTDLSFLDTPGYIAGVTNPMFLERDAWYVQPLESIPLTHPVNTPYQCILSTRPINYQHALLINAITLLLTHPT